jgi:hypothetical protein
MGRRRGEWSIATIKLLPLEVNIAVMRAFVHLREMLASHKDLARKLEELESKYDQRFQMVFEAIRQLMAAEQPEKKRRIGFAVPAEK